MGSELAPPEMRTLLAGELTPEQRRDASRFVLRHARDRNDLRDLLDALGLNPPPRTSSPQ